MSLEPSKELNDANVILPLFEKKKRNSFCLSVKCREVDGKSSIPYAYPFKSCTYLIFLFVFVEFLEAVRNNSTSSFMLLLQRNLIETRDTEFVNEKKMFTLVGVAYLQNQKSNYFFYLRLCEIFFDKLKMFCFSAISVRKSLFQVQKIF